MLAAIWISLEWTFDHRAQLQELRRPALVLILLPWLGVIAVLADPNVKNLTSGYAASIGMQETDVTLLAVLVAIVLTLGIIFSLALYYLISLVIFFGISTITLLIIYGSSWLSRISQRQLGRDYVKGAALIVVLLGTIHKVFFR